MSSFVHVSFNCWAVIHGEVWPHVRLIDQELCSVPVGSPVNLGQPGPTWADAQCFLHVKIVGMAWHLGERCLPSMAWFLVEVLLCFTMYSPPVSVRYWFVTMLQYVTVCFVVLYDWRLHTGRALFDSIHFNPPAIALSGRAPRDYGRVSGRLQCLAESETHNYGCIGGLSHWLWLMLLCCWKFFHTSR